MSFTKLTLVLMLGMSACFQANAEFKFKTFKVSQELKAKNNHLKSIFDQLEEVIRNQGYKAVNLAIKAILLQRHKGELGEHHFPDMNWSTGVNSKIQIGFQRKLEPRLDGEGWIVKDRTVLGVGAQVYLRYLQEQGDVEIDEETLKLFAGIFYKKEYTFQHQALTYKDGLTQNINKLLGSYRVFKGTNFMNLAEGEIVTQQDYMSADIGMRVKTPSVYWLRLKGEAKVYFSRLEKLTYMKQADPNETTTDFKVSFERMKVLGKRLQLELQLDFFNLVNLTLFGAEYRKDITRGRRSSYLFDEEQTYAIPHDQELLTAFESLAKGKDPEKIEALDSFKLSSEDTFKVAESARVYSLMWGKVWGNLTEEISFNIDDSTHYLYRYQQERVAFNRNLLKLIFSPRRFGSSRSREVENLLFEYESPTKIDPTKLTSLPKESAISFKLSKEFSSKRKSSRDRKKLLNLIKTFDEIDDEVLARIEQGNLKPPYYLDMHAQVSKKGLLKLLGQTPSELTEITGFACSGKWIKPGQRLSKSVRRCMKRFRDYQGIIMTEYFVHNKLSLFHIKSFLGHLSQFSFSFKPLKVLFGVENVQLYGEFRAKEFVTYHKEGPFQGGGIIKEILLSP